MFTYRIKILQVFYSFCPACKRQHAISHVLGYPYESGGDGDETGVEISHPLIHLIR